eukprot:COSAG01_NODE_5729_length_4071_cov_9.539023_3_plen_50_part_00
MGAPRGCWRAFSACRRVHARAPPRAQDIAIPVVVVGARCDINEFMSMGD